MDKEVKQFIQAHIDLIDDNDFEKLYRKASILTDADVGKLTTVLLEAGIDPLEHMNHVPEEYMCWCDVKNLVIPDGFTGIGEDAFAGCSLLETITIPDSVTSIGKNAFSGCESLRSINVPSKVNAILISTFAGCKALKEIVIPGQVTTIGDWSLVNCQSLQKVKLEQGVETIGSCAFQNCEALREVELPSTLKTIGSSVFFNCSSLERIIYKGTSEQWYSINKGVDWKAKSLITKVICSDKVVNI